MPKSIISRLEKLEKRKEETEEIEDLSEYYKMLYGEEESDTERGD